MRKKKRLCADREGRCGECHKPLNGDAYCRYCGTKAGEGSFEPYEDVICCVYGPPPVEREHVCKACGYEWTSFAMIDAEKYCPRCGGEVSSKEITDRSDER